jgi:hypothetical protein
LQTKPNQKPITKTDLPVLEISNERYKARNLILADGRLAPINRQLFNTKKEMPPKPEEEGRNKNENKEPIETFGYQDYNLDHEEQSQDAGIKGAGPEFREAPPVPEIEKKAQESPFSRSNAVVLLKVLTALLIMLLAIEAILYLI